MSRFAIYFQTLVLRNVCQYQLLPFDLLQCIPHGKPPCHLLMLRDRIPVSINPKLQHPIT
ncbi:hypothetical protein EI427_24520 [Flammeovirga pectinis]|uniref:Uncharacterized protein n=1 Tax=Flammeovirga pectinis TaxID=2494373 RepID=A0A3Q9FVA6_9BACT|nr:hypothetical protein EI427_24520 [Flammeovirga pectinis]